MLPRTCMRCHRHVCHLCAAETLLPNCSNLNTLPCSTRLDLPHMFSVLTGVPCLPAEHSGGARRPLQPHPRLAARQGVQQAALRLHAAERGHVSQEGERRWRERRTRRCGATCSIDRCGCAPQGLSLWRSTFEVGSVLSLVLESDE